MPSAYEDTPSDANPVNVPIGTAGALDTANPVTSRPVGTVVGATDCGHRWIGPRGNLTEKTWASQLAVGLYPDPGTDAYDGNLSQAVCTMRSRAQINLPNAWTSDVVFRPSGVSHSSDANLPIFTWDFGGSVFALEIGIKGGGAAAADQRKIYATIRPVTNGTGGSTTTLTGTSQVSVGTAYKNTHVARLVRNVDTAYLFVDGALEATATGIGTARHDAPAAAFLGTPAKAWIARGTTAANHLFAGRVPVATLRAGAFTDATKSLRGPVFTHSQSYHFAMYGNASMAGSFPRDRSLFGQDIIATNVSVDTLDNDSTPWFLPAVQSGTKFSDAYGVTSNIVIIGGYAKWSRAS